MAEDHPIVHKVPFVTEFSTDAPISVPFVESEKEIKLPKLIRGKGFRDIRELINSDVVSHVISFTGDTNAGKSTMIRSLLQLDLHPENQDNGPNIGTGENPTTSDVCLYKKFDDDIFYLDYEGNSAPDLLPADNNSGQRDFELRRQATMHHLPRLAYVVSDIVVYLSRQPLLNHEIYERVLKTAHSANDGVIDVHKPQLIIISNLQPQRTTTNAGLWEVDVATRKFFENHESQEPQLEKFYSDVKCLVLPEDEATKQWDRQIEIFRNLVKNMLDKRDKEKQKMGVLYNQRVWYNVFNTVLSQFNLSRGLSMSEILSLGISKQIGGSYKRAIQFFCAFNTSFDGDNFCKIAELSYQYLATLIGREISLLVKALGYDNIMSTEQQAKIMLHRSTRNKKDYSVRDFFEDFSNEISFLAPCQALMQNQKKKIQCTYTQGIHGPKHRNPNFKVYTGSKISRMLKTVVKNKTVAEWSGDNGGQFSPPSSLATVTTDKLFYSTLKTLCTKEYLEHTKFFVVTMIELIIKAKTLSPITEWKFSANCAFCFSDDNLQLESCNHHICSRCKNDIYQTGGALLESPLTKEWVKPRCPLQH